jgi:hypothetical protein
VLPLLLNRDWVLHAMVCCTCYQVRPGLDAMCADAFQAMLHASAAAACWGWTLALSLSFVC